MDRPGAGRLDLAELRPRAGRGAGRPGRPFEDPQGTGHQVIGSRRPEGLRLAPWAQPARLPQRRVDPRQGRPDPGRAGVLGRRGDQGADPADLGHVQQRQGRLDHRRRRPDGRGRAGREGVGSGDRRLEDDPGDLAGSDGRGRGAGRCADRPERARRPGHRRRRAQRLDRLLGLQGGRPGQVRHRALPPDAPSQANRPRQGRAEFRPGAG